EEEFDVAIIGSGPLGLATALNLATKWKVGRIVVLERQDDVEPLEIAPFYQVSNKYHLSRLGQLVLPMWRELEKQGNLSTGSLLTTSSGFLYVGPSASSMAEFCRNLSITTCTLLSPTQVANEHPFMTVNQSAVHMSESGYVNVTLLLTTLRALVAKTPNILVRDKETFLNLSRTDNQSRVHIETTRGSINATKVILLPGAYAKTTMDTLGLHLNISLYELPTAVYFRRLPVSNSNLTVLTWLFASADNDQFTGYPPEQSDYLRIEPRINTARMRTLDSPHNRTNKPDQQILDRTRRWASQHLAQTSTYFDGIECSCGTKQWSFSYGTFF
ncbi:unnamed protein product, partial [Didymodactylos carnosus]